MARGNVYYSLAVLALSFGLAIASYHFVENPFRRATSDKVRKAIREITRREYQPTQSSRYAVLGVMALVVVSVGAFALSDSQVSPVKPPSIAVMIPVRRRGRPGGDRTAQ